MVRNRWGPYPRQPHTSIAIDVRVEGDTDHRVIYVWCRAASEQQTAPAIHVIVTMARPVIFP